MTKDEALKLALSTLNEVRQETFHAEKKVWEAIYTIKKVLSQPQRTWVGLTNGEMIELSEMKLGSWDLILEVEAKLKDKNT